MPRAKKAPIDTPAVAAEFNLFEADVTHSPEVPSEVEAPKESEPKVETPKYKVKVCSEECPHYTRASQECELCWSKLYPK